MSRQSSEIEDEGTPIGRAVKSPKKTFSIEYRVKPAIWIQWLKTDAWQSKMTRSNGWRKWKAYANEYSRQQAIEIISSRQDYFGKYHEFRLI